MLRRTAIMAATFLAMVLATAVPAFAQGLETVEPTLAECRAFVQANGVPETRPVWENRGYSGWDVCLNMAYDGDLAGYFASADADADGRLDAAEQAAYMDSVIGPVSDPDQSPLTLEKCEALIAANGIPRERPFVDWSNRGYGEVDICQSLAFDGALAASFAAADSNGDGRIDLAEREAYVASVSGGAGGAISQAQDESIVNGQYGTSAAQEQYENTGATTVPEETTAAPTEPSTEPTISAVPVEPVVPTETAESAQTDEPEKGVLSAVNTAVEEALPEPVAEALPETGGVALLGVLGGAALIGGGFLAYRRFR